MGLAALATGTLEARPLAAETTLEALTHTVEIVAEAPIDLASVPGLVALPEGDDVGKGSSAGAQAPRPLKLDQLRDGLAEEEDDALTFAGRRVPRSIVETIVKAGAVTGVDPVYLMALADKESSFEPENKAATSSAEGLFQFIDTTWIEMMRSFGSKHGLDDEVAAIQGQPGALTIADDGTRARILDLRRDPYLAALMAAEMLKRDRIRIERRLGRSLTRSEPYLAHFFGPDSAFRFMALVTAKPEHSAPQEFPAAAKANRSLFFARSGRKTRHLTVAEVYEKLDTMIDERLERYESVSAVATAAERS